MAEKIDDSAMSGWAAIAKEIVEKLPIEDIAKPGAKPAGQLIADLIKTVQLAAFPLQFAGVVQDRLRSFIDRSVRNVPEENRVPPPPQILGPVLEYIRYEPEGTPIDEMFAQLLSRAMDSQRSGEAHPAFPHLIRQISADEAHLLRYIASEDTPIRLIKSTPFDSILKVFLPDQTTIIVDDLPDTDLMYAENKRFYVEHLFQLGLITVPQIGNQIPLMENGNQVGSEARYDYRLSETGKRFMSACMLRI